MLSERKREILSAAGTCFSKYGYEKTTLDDIAGIVGINKASFYYHFRNKEEIFKELITGEADLFIRETIGKADKVPDCKERILTWISESFNYLQNNSILHQLSFESLKTFRPFLIDLVQYSKQKGTEYLTETLDFYSGQGKLKPVDTGKTASVIQNIIYALKDYLHQNTVSGQEPDIQEKIREDIRESVSMILDGIIL